MRNKLEFMLAGGEVKRYHTLHTLRTQTIADHSFGVAWLCWLLSAGVPSAALLMAALQHDLAEHTTGDMPAPAKRSMAIGAQFVAAEDAALLRAGFPPMRLTCEELRVLKLADIAELLLFCIREIKSGNRKMADVYRRGKDYVEEMSPLYGIQRELFTLIEEMHHER